MYPAPGGISPSPFFHSTLHKDNLVRWSTWFVTLGWFIFECPTPDGGDSSTSQLAMFVVIYPRYFLTSNWLWRVMWYKLNLMTSWYALIKTKWFDKFSHISKGFQNFNPGLRSGLWSGLRSGLRSRPRQRTPNVWFLSTLAPPSYHICKENCESNFYREKEHIWGTHVSDTIFFPMGWKSQLFSFNITFFKLNMEIKIQFFCFALTLNFFLRFVKPPSKIWIFF